MCLFLHLSTLCAHEYLRLTIKLAGQQDGERSVRRYRRSPWKCNLTPSPPHPLSPLPHPMQAWWYGLCMTASSGVCRIYVDVIRNGWWSCFTLACNAESLWVYFFKTPSTGTSVNNSYSFVAVCFFMSDICFPKIHQGWAPKFNAIALLYV